MPGGLSKAVGPFKPALWTRPANSGLRQANSNSAPRQINGNSAPRQINGNSAPRQINGNSALRQALFSEKWSRGLALGGAPVRRGSHVGGGEWTQQELKEHIKWIKKQLGDDRLKSIQDLKMAVNDGVTMVRLLEVLSKEQIAGVNQAPVTRSERQNNLQICIDFLRKRGAVTHELIPHDLITGETRSVLIFVRNMRVVFDKTYSQNSAPGSRKSSEAKNGRPAAQLKQPTSGMPGSLQESPHPSMKNPKKISETHLHPDGVSQLVISETRASSLTSTLTSLPGELQADTLYPNSHSSSCMANPLYATVPTASLPPPPPPKERTSAPTRPTNGDLNRNGSDHGAAPVSNNKRPVTPVSFVEPQSDSTGATVIASKRRQSSDTTPPSSASSHPPHNSQNPRTDPSLPYSRHSRSTGESLAVSTRTYQAAIWDLGASRAVDGTTDKGAGALSQPGATLSITSCMSSDFYTDDTDDTGMRAALNYPLIDRFGSAGNLINRPGPAMGYYRDSPEIWGDEEEEEDDLIPPELLPSPSIRAKLRLLLSGRTGPESDMSSEPDIYGSVTSMDDLAVLRHQMTGLEGMYRELLRHVGMEPGPVVASQSQQSSLQRLPSNQSVTSAPRRYMRHLGGRRSHELRAMGRRVEKLETHVVTLAQSVAEISSDLERLRVSARESRSSSAAIRAPPSVRAIAPPEAPAEPPPRVRSGLERVRHHLRHPKRLAKLKWFFGQEPPFLKEFLASFGYEKYVGLFEKEDIGLQELPLMTEERLKALGLPLGPRLRLLEEINAAFENPTSS